MAIKNYTTAVAAYRTVTELQARLVKFGVRELAITYSEGGEPLSLTFAFPVNGNILRFRLENNTEGVLKAMQKAKVEKRYLTREHANKVAWRIKKDFVEAQLALVEAELASLPELFLADMTNESGTRLVQLFVESGQSQNFLNP